MTLKDFYQSLSGLNLPLAYDHFEEGKLPKPPFMVYRVLSSNNHSADNWAFHKNLDVTLELYTSKKDLDSESQVEGFLDSHLIYFDKIEVYIPSEKLYQVTYTITLEGENNDTE